MPENTIQNTAAAASAPKASAYRILPGTVFGKVMAGDRQCPESVLRAMKVIGKADSSDPAIPRASDYIFRSGLLTEYAEFFGNPYGDVLCLFGPSGTGKTSSILEYCARTNWGAEVVTVSSDFRASDMIGQFVVKSLKPGEPAQTFFQYGPLVRAMIHGRAFILSEFDLSRPGELVGLNDIVSHTSRLQIAANGDEIIRPAWGFRFIVCGNTPGRGDPYGIYADARRQNESFLNRMRFVRVSYGTPEQEKAIILNAEPRMREPRWEGLPELMVKVANEVRASHAKGECSAAFSVRFLIRWAHLMNGAPRPFIVRNALERTFLAGVTDEGERAFIEQACNAILGRWWTESDPSAVRAP